MARLFNDTASEYAEMDTAVVTAYPFTVAGWFKTDDTATEGTIWFAGDRDVNNHLWRITCSTRLFFGCNAGATLVVAQTSPNSVVVDTWHHFCGLATSATSRTIYIDGGDAGSNVTSRTPIGVDRTSIGRTGIATPEAYMSGAVDHVAVWRDLALTPTEIAQLATGLSPLRIQRAALVDYRRLGYYNPELNWMAAGETMAIVGTTVVAGPPKALTFLSGLGLDGYGVGRFGRFVGKEASLVVPGPPRGSMLLLGAGR